MKSNVFILFLSLTERPNENLTDQWLGVSVASQATTGGMAVVSCQSALSYIQSVNVSKNCEVCKKFVMWGLIIKKGERKSLSRGIFLRKSDIDRLTLTHSKPSKYFL